MFKLIYKTTAGSQIIRQGIGKLLALHIIKELKRTNPNNYKLGEFLIIKN
jgi:hypothetical protein